jgi:hypothetical protein
LGLSSLGPSCATACTDARFSTSLVRCQTWVDLPLKFADLLNQASVLRRVGITATHFNDDYTNSAKESLRKFTGLIVHSILQFMEESLYFTHQQPHNWAGIMNDDDEQAASDTFVARTVEWEAIRQSEGIIKDHGHARYVKNNQ